MKICVFGADGRTGKEVVELLKKGGHQVTTFVYTSKTKAKNQFEGDVTKDHEAIDKAVKGNEVVISTLGHVRGTSDYMQSDGMKLITKAMKKHGCKKIVVITGTGIRQNGDKPSIVDRLINLSFILGLYKVYRDGKKHVEIIEKSGLTYVILRVVLLSSKPGIQEYSYSAGGPAMWPTHQLPLQKL